MAEADPSADDGQVDALNALVEDLLLKVAEKDCEIDECEERLAAMREQLEAATSSASSCSGSPRSGAVGESGTEPRVRAVHEADETTPEECEKALCTLGLGSLCRRRIDFAEPPATEDVSVASSTQIVLHPSLATKASALHAAFEQLFPRVGVCLLGYAIFAWITLQADCAGSSAHGYVRSIR